MNSTSGVNDACIAANAGSEWKCIFAEHTSPHIKTPIFPLQGEYDSWRECPLKPCPVLPRSGLSSALSRSGLSC